MKAFLISVFCLCSMYTLSAQVNGLTIKGYVDTYYASYNNNLQANTFQPITGVAPRNKSFGVNIVQLSLHYKAKNYRTNVGLHFGDMPLAVWNKDGFNNIQEANIGIHLLKHLWLDVGFFLSHLAEENYHPKDNLMSIWSVSAFCGPSYQSGARLSYEGFQNLDLELWMINGYERVYDNNTAKSYGFLMRYRLTPKDFLAYSVILGDESSDPTKKAFRWHQHLYVNYTLANFLTFAVGLDAGAQNNATFRGTYILGKIRFSSRHSISGRYEGFYDPAGVLTGTFAIQGESYRKGVNLVGLTAGYEYKPEPNSFIRFESRFLGNRYAGQELFGNMSSRLSYVFTAGYHFDTSKFRR